MPIIDIQIHEPGPFTDWSADTTDAQWRVLVELTISHLDSIGVHGVVLFPMDTAWAAWAAATFPERFAYVPKITPDEPDLEGLVRAAKQNHAKGQVGLRGMIGWPGESKEIQRLDAGAWDPIFAACERHQEPLFLFMTSWIAHVAKIAARYPRLTLILDHVGLPQPPGHERDNPPFKRLPEVLDLAKFPNLHIKLCGLPSLSLEPYPYSDVAPRLRAIADAFGADRLMWASDTTRFFGRVGMPPRNFPKVHGPYPGKHSYAEALHFVRDSGVLSAVEKEAILGGTAQRVLGWSPK